MLKKASALPLKVKAAQAGKRQPHTSEVVDPASSARKPVKKSSSDTAAMAAPAAATAGRGQAGVITGYVDTFASGIIEGWAIDRLDLSRRLQIRAFADGKEIGSAVCKLYHEAVHKSGAGDGRYGFRLTYDDVSIPRDQISVLVDDSGHSFRLPLNHSTFDAQPAKQAAYIGFIEQVAAGELIGWALDRGDLSRRVKVRATADNKLLGDAHANLFRQDLLKSGAGDGRYGFQITFDPAVPIGDIIVSVDDAAAPYRLPLTPDATAGLASLQRASRDMPSQGLAPAGKQGSTNEMAALQAQVRGLQAELAQFKSALGQSIEKLGLVSAEAAAIAPLTQELRGPPPPPPPEQVSWRARSIYRQLLRRIEAST